MDVRDDIGLSIDMMDADRLREWARLLLVHGADISHWGSVPYVASKMQIMATDIEKAVRDIGALRVEAALCSVISALEGASGCAPAPQWLPIETAPSGETWILVWYPIVQSYAVGRGLHRPSEFESAQMHKRSPNFVPLPESDDKWKPTHWMPLPAAPVPAESDQPTEKP